MPSELLVFVQSDSREGSVPGKINDGAKTWSNITNLLTGVERCAPLLFLQSNFTDWGNSEREY